MASGKNLLSCVMTLKNLLTLVQPCNWSNMIDCQDANFNFTHCTTDSSFSSSLAHSIPRLFSTSPKMWSSQVADVLKHYNLLWSSRPCHGGTVSKNSGCFRQCKLCRAELWLPGKQLPQAGETALNLDVEWTLSHFRPRASGTEVDNHCSDNLGHAREESTMAQAVILLLLHMTAAHPVIEHELWQSAVVVFSSGSLLTPPLHQRNMEAVTKSSWLMIHFWASSCSFNYTTVFSNG